MAFCQFNIIDAAQIHVHVPENIYALAIIALPLIYLAHTLFRFEDRTLLSNQTKEPFIYSLTFTPATITWECVQCGNHLNMFLYFEGNQFVFLYYIFILCTVFVLLHEGKIILCMLIYPPLSLLEMNARECHSFQKFIYIKDLYIIL